MKIVVVGGGTAGWLAALMISKITPENQVTVIESSKIGIIGAGEGSTGLLTNIIANTLWEFDCDVMEFIVETGATLKYGINFKDWKTVGESYLAPLGGSPQSRGNYDAAFAYQNCLDPKKLHLASDLGYRMEHLLSSYSTKDFKFKDTNFSFHFDAHKVGKYFQKKTLADNSTQLIDDVVTQVHQDQQGFITHVETQGGKVVNGDFWIDASGFARVLMKHMNNPWISYRDNLPVNTAMPFLVPYEENETPEPWTTAWAQSSGWMWQIPTLDRKGCGYVYCDEFITADQAHQEIERTLGRPIEPIRTLKFDTGRLQDAWVNNCVAVGLSMAFAEPLEATSIHSTIVQLINWVFDHCDSAPTYTHRPSAVNIYNRNTATMYDDFKEFLNLHYMGGRTDSEFWRWIATGAITTDRTRDLVAYAQERQPTNKQFGTYFGGVGWELYCWVLAGTGNLPPSASKRTLALTDAQASLDLLAETYANFQHNNSVDHQDTLTYERFISLARRKQSGL